MIPWVAVFTNLDAKASGALESIMRLNAIEPADIHRHLRSVAEEVARDIYNKRWGIMFTQAQSTRPTANLYQIIKQKVVGHNIRGLLTGATKSSISAMVDETGVHAGVTGKWPLNAMKSYSAKIAIGDILTNMSEAWSLKKMGSTRMTETGSESVSRSRRAMPVDMPVGTYRVREMTRAGRDRGVRGIKGALGSYSRVRYRITENGVVVVRGRPFAPHLRSEARERVEPIKYGITWKRRRSIPQAMAMLSMPSTSEKMIDVKIGPGAGLSIIWPQWAKEMFNLNDIINPPEPYETKRFNRGRWTAVDFFSKEFAPGNTWENEGASRGYWDWIEEAIYGYVRNIWMGGGDIGGSKIAQSITNLARFQRRVVQMLRSRVAKTMKAYAEIYESPYARMGISQTVQRTKVYEGVPWYVRGVGMVYRNVRMKPGGIWPAETEQIDYGGKRMLSLIGVDNWVSGALTDEFETIKDQLKQEFFEVLTPTHGRLFLEAEDMVRREVEDVLIATQQARFLDPTNVLGKPTIGEALEKTSREITVTEFMKVIQRFETVDRATLRLLGLGGGKRR